MSSANMPAYKCYSENPLNWLMSRKGSNGKPFLSSSQYYAGLLLYRDFYQSNICSMVSLNLESIHDSQSIFSSALTDSYDNALDAQTRVRKALSAVGPELAEPLVDVCCHMQSLKYIEKKYQWPPRSGKIILRLALEALCRYYKIDKMAIGERFESNILSEQTSDNHYCLK